MTSTPSLERFGVDRLPSHHAHALAARVAARWHDAEQPLHALYGTAVDLDALLRVVVDAAAARPEDLRRLDHRREIVPDWYQREQMVGYVCYVDRFAGTLTGIADRLDHLRALGVTYLHLMPILKPREGDNDGGYAVADYDQVDPRLGTMDDLEKVARTLRDEGMSLCVDLVLNHTAAEHPWARAAAAGDARYRDYYLTFPDRQQPDAYEATLPEVFPDTAPGSFTWVEEMGRWVWTTFHPWQWDLDYTNPAVFAEMLAVMLRLANRGVDVLRLDAIPFMWKRLGTDCQNQPEVHLLIKAFRALVGMAAPAVIFKGEAIVPPDRLVPYLGAHDREEPECHLAYHNQLMVQAWSSLAARDGRLATTALGHLHPTPPSTTWVTYVRCHDDIGWAIADGDAAAVGWDGTAHRRFLADFYAGDFPGSFARGARFQVNPHTGDARTSGSAAALCGIQAAREAGDDAGVEAGIRRLLLLYALIASYEGIPLVYAGDEVALGNDRSYEADPRTARDNRWLHRPWIDWSVVARREQPGTVEQRVFDGLRRLLRIRACLAPLRAGGQVTPIGQDNPHVLAFGRRHPRTGRFLGLANFHEDPQHVDAQAVGYWRLREPRDALAGDGAVRFADGRILLDGLTMAWIAEP